MTKDPVKMQVWEYREFRIAVFPSGYTSIHVFNPADSHGLGNSIGAEGISGLEEAKAWIDRLRG